MGTNYKLDFCLSSTNEHKPVVLTFGFFRIVIEETWMISGKINISKTSKTTLHKGSTFQATDVDHNNTIQTTKTYPYRTAWNKTTSQCNSLCWNQS